MSEPSSGQPKWTPRTVADKAARSDRLASEMKKNLMKRKRQQREQAAHADEGRTPTDSDPERRS